TEDDREGPNAGEIVAVRDVRAVAVSRSRKDRPRRASRAALAHAIGAWIKARRIAGIADAVADDSARFIHVAIALVRVVVERAIVPAVGILVSIVVVRLASGRCCEFQGR